MQNPNKLKSKNTLSSLVSDCKVNKYMSAGQVDELNKLRKYRRDRDVLTWDAGDSWYQ